VIPSLFEYGNTYLTPKDFTDPHMLTVALLGSVNWENM
jgi:hypothetical protein